MPEVLNTFTVDKLQPIESLYQKIYEDDKNKRDVYCKLGDLTIDAINIPGMSQTEFWAQKEEFDEDIITSDQVTNSKNSERYKFTLYSFKQLMRKLGIPTNYIVDRCPDWLARENINTFVDLHRDDEVLLRVRDKKTEENAYTSIRGILKASYGIFDNRELIETLMPIMAENDLQLWNYVVTDTDFHAKLIFSDTVNVGTRGKPDEVNVGIHIANSEIGLRPLSMDFMVFRLQCMNGMIAMIDGQRLFSKRHTNIDRTEIRSGFKNAFHTLKNRKGDILNKYRSAKYIHFDKPFFELKKIMARFPVFSKERADRIEKELKQGLDNGNYEANLYSICQAITRTAQDMTAQTRMRMEEAAGIVMLNSENDNIQTLDLNDGDENA